MTLSPSHVFPERLPTGRHDETLAARRQTPVPVSILTISSDGTLQRQHLDDDADEDDPHRTDQGIQECLKAHATLRGNTPIPEELRIVSDSGLSSDSLDALELIDSESSSVTVEIALWHQPCGERIDGIAWRRVFTWMVDGNPDAQQVTILTPPERKRASIVGAYSYTYENTPRYGVLSLAETDDGWRIVDCWGLIEDAARVEELADGFLSSDINR